MPSTILSCSRSSTKSGTHQGLSSRMRSRISPSFSATSRARPWTSRSSSCWWRSFTVRSASPSASTGAIGRRLSGSITLRSSRAWTSSSRTTAEALRSAPAAWRTTMRACSGSRSHSAARRLSWAARSLAPSTSGERKLFWTKLPRLRPIRSFRCGMMAVCGIGRLSGRRNSAVMANQSATPPTMPASAVART